MFNFLPEVAKSLHQEMLNLYWILIVPFTLFVIILEFFKMPESAPSGGRIIRRVMISMILIWSFDEILSVIAFLGDGLATRIGGMAKLWDLVNHMGARFEEESGTWIKFKDAIIFVISLLSYIVAYLGVFVANVLIQFVWSILYICSPIMILLYIAPATSHVTSNLFKGLLNVMSWKILWSILGVILIKFASTPQTGDWENFLTNVLINLCIGISMLFIPVATKSLLNDGLTSAASALAAIPTVAAGAVVKQMTIGNAKASLGQALGGAKNKVHNFRRNVRRDS